MKTKHDNYLHYIETTYAGQKLLEKHSLSEVGVWKINGEDPNCDLGGHHSNPHLMTVEGKLEEVIKMAVNLPNFYTWGGGGNIEKIKIENVGSAAQRQNKIKEIQDKMRELENDLKEIQ